ncbi:MAG TPA: hypothetical protein VF721_05090 [Pyrinomonadaceae bacterium]
MGENSQSKLFIKQKKGVFYADGRKIDAKLVDNLLEALNDTGRKINLADYGITQEWLNANAEKSLPQYLQKSAPNEKDLFLKHFRDIKFIEEKILYEVLFDWWTDDYPSVELKIVKKDNSKIELNSSAQTDFMLPWKLVENEKNYSFANPRLSRAVADLLPQKFTNKERLSGKNLAPQMAREIYNKIEAQLEELETQNKIGAELARIKDRYTVRKTAISGISSIDTGTPSSAYQSGDAEYQKWNFLSWNAELKRNDLPANVIIGVSLPYKEGKLSTFDAFLGNIDAIISRALSVEWLGKYIAENPETELEIRFVGDRSFSPKAQESFLEDLKVFGANALNAEILNQLEKCVFLQVSEKGSKWSRWLILPDKRMILWQVNGDSALKWKPADFETRNMYKTKDWFQMKAIILPNGEIESR